MDKATPINQLPNVEMSMEPEMNSQQMPPVNQPMPQNMPSMNHQMPPMAQNMPPPMAPNMPPNMPPPMATNNLNMRVDPYRENPYQPPPQQQPRQEEKKEKVVEEFGMVQDFMNDIKPLSMIFAILLFIQLDSTQGLFTRITRLFNIGDSMVFTVSKVIAAFAGVLVFFFLSRNL